MLDRIATYAQNRWQLSEFMRVQREALDAQAEVSTGKRLQTFAEAPFEIGGLMALKGAEARAAEGIAGAEAMQRRLRLQDTYLSQASTTIETLREQIFEAASTGRGVEVMSQVQAAFQQLRSLYNQAADGKHLFAGTRTDVAPVAPRTLAELGALPTTADAFENNDVAPVGRLDDGSNVALADLASDLAGPMMDVFRAIQAFQTGPDGPFADQLTQAQRDFLISQLQPIAAAATAANEATARNGQTLRQAEDQAERLADSRDVYRELISKAEDANLVEAVQKLTASQTALEASAKSFRSIQGLSLLDFI